MGNSIPGEQGPPGPQGEQGEQGPQGEDGPAQELIKRTVEGDIVRDGIFAGIQSKSVATCNSDEIPTGGGFERDGHDTRTIFSKPVDN